MRLLFIVVLLLQLSLFAAAYADPAHGTADQAEVTSPSQDDHPHTAIEEADHSSSARDTPQAHHSGDPVEENHGDEDGIEHAHWGGNGPESALEQTISDFGIYHAAAVHFPVALILAAALAQALYLATNAAGYVHTVRFLMWAGAFGALAAGILGWAHAGPAAPDETGILQVHRWLGTGLVPLLFLCAGLIEWGARLTPWKPVWISSIVVGIAAAGVAVNGYLGGSLAHTGFGHLSGG